MSQQTTTTIVLGHVHNKAIQESKKCELMFDQDIVQLLKSKDEGYVTVIIFLMNKKGYWVEGMDGQVWLKKNLVEKLFVKEIPKKATFMVGLANTSFMDKITGVVDNVVDAVMLLDDSKKGLDVFSSNGKKAVTMKYYAASKSKTDDLEKSRLLNNW